MQISDSVFSAEPAAGLPLIVGICLRIRTEADGDDGDDDDGDGDGDDTEST